MTKPIFCTLFMLCAFFSTAQSKNWNLEAHLPVSVGNSFNSDTRGLMDFGVGYRFYSSGDLNLGISFNYTRFADESIGLDNANEVREIEYRDQFFQPRLFAEFTPTNNKRLVLGGGLGYTFTRSVGQLFFNEEGRIDGFENSGGFNLNIQASYNITSDWYLNIQYDLILLNSDFYPDTKIGLLKFGGGIRF